MMSAADTLLLELVIMCGLGAILIVVGIIIAVVRHRRAARCTAQTMGFVTTHRLSGSGRMAPVVEYEVDGETYDTVRKFNAVITTTAVPRRGARTAWVSEKDVLHVKLGAINNIAQLAEDTWPTDSEMEVFYDPSDPAFACAGRRPAGVGFTSAAFLGSGAFVVLLGLFANMLMRL